MSRTRLAAVVGIVVLVGTALTVPAGGAEAPPGAGATRATLRGEVLLPEGSSPDAYYWIDLWRERADGTWQALYNLDRAEDPSFQVTGLKPGRYKVFFSPSPGDSGAAPRWYGGPGAPDGVLLSTDSPVVEAGAGEVVDLEPTALPYAATSFGGDFTEPAYAYVAVYAAEEPLAQPVGEGNLTGPSAWASGSQVPGSYVAWARPLAFDENGQPLFDAVWYGGATTRQEATVIELGEESLTGLTLTVPQNPTVRATERPSLKGRARVGRTLVVDTGAWPEPPNRFTFQWFAGPFELYGADKPRLVLKRRHLGVRIRAVVSPRRGDVRYVPAGTPKSDPVRAAG